MQHEALKSNIEWKKWGEEDPLFGVATWRGKSKDGESPWTEDEFYALGRSDWGDFWMHWKNYGVNTRNCLEFGCGAGRMTRQISGEFEHVLAVDVSEGMIRCARKAVRPNVEFSIIDGTHLPIPDSSVSAVFSTHVLQHLDSAEIGYAYFREFYRVLDSGGTLMIHLPIYIFPGNVLTKVGTPAYALVRKVGDLRAMMRRRMGTRTMRGTRYSLNELYTFLSSLGFKKIEFNIFPTTSNESLHPFVFATK